MKHLITRKKSDQQRALFHDAFQVTEASVDNTIGCFIVFQTVRIIPFEYCSYIGEEMVGYYAAIPYRYKIGKVTTDVEWYVV